MSDDILDQPASASTLRQLHRAGVINDETLRRCTAVLHPASAWLAWVRLNLQLIGAALILAGVVFFFAYNWKVMGRFEKLGLIEVSILITLVAACWKGVSTLPGKLLMLAASVLVGVFLAVFGQIYQTGADAYELFTGWAALILLWVFLTRFAALWFFWLVLLQTGTLLFWMQVAVRDRDWDWDFKVLSVVLAVINALALVSRETAFARGCEWLSGRWHRVILYFAVLGWLTVPVVWRIFDFDDDLAAYLAVWLLAAGGGYFVYRKWIPDFTCLSLAAADVALVFLVWVGRVLFSEIWDNEPFGMFLLYAIIIGLTTTGLTFWLAKEYKTMRTPKTGGPPPLPS